MTALTAHAPTLKARSADEDQLGPNRRAQDAPRAQGKSGQIADARTGGRPPEEAGIRAREGRKWQKSQKLPVSGKEHATRGVTCRLVCTENRSTTTRP